MVMIKGQGMSNVGGVSRRMVQFGPSIQPLTDLWQIIDKNVPHEFFPEVENMIVVSFHTCEAAELEEIAYGTGETRLYEG